MLLHNLYFWLIHCEIILLILYYFVSTLQSRAKIKEIQVRLGLELNFVLTKTHKIYLNEYRCHVLSAYLLIIGLYTRTIILIILDYLYINKNIIFTPIYIHILFLLIFFSSTFFLTAYFSICYSIILFLSLD